MKKILFATIATLLFLSGSAIFSFAAEDNAGAAAQGEMGKAQQETQKASSEFSQGNGNPGIQQNGQTSWSQAASAVPDNAAPTAQTAPSINPALQGSPETGYAGTWTDPANGDIVTSVIAPAPQPNQNYQNYPMIIEPQVSGDSWGNSSQSWQGGYQWPTSPDNPGYPPAQQNPPYNAPPPPGWHPYYPGQPYPGFNPYPYPFPQPYPGYNQPWVHPAPPQFNPGMPGSTPPPFNPNYRPLRPTPPPPSTNPPPHGTNPPPGPGFGSTPGGIWQPGMNPPGQGNWTPPPPGPQVRPLPMQPAGQSWHRSPFAPQPPSRGGIFGNGGSVRRGGN